MYHTEGEKIVKNWLCWTLKYTFTPLEAHTLRNPFFLNHLWGKKWTRLVIWVCVAPFLAVGIGLSPYVEGMQIILRLRSPIRQPLSYRIYGIFHFETTKHKVILHWITMKYAVSHYENASHMGLHNLCIFFRCKNRQLQGSILTLVVKFKVSSLPNKMKVWCTGLLLQ